MANVRGLDDLRDEEDDKGKFNDYYAGGEKSGQLLRGAPESESDNEEEEDRVAKLFNKARRAGARQGTAADLDEPSAAFKGAARTLAGGEVGQAKAADEGPRTRVITFYNNGVFTVDNGPPRRVDDPANAPFIQSISKGECPEELDTGRPGAPVTVNLVRKEEPYAEPEKPRYNAFQGAGRTLGSTAATASASTSAAAEDDEGEWAGVDESKPTTSIQLRLADGSRSVARFNMTHRISDIRRFIRASSGAQGPYQLMTAFPNKVIEDESQTLEAAGLLNAVIIQKK